MKKHSFFLSLLLSAAVAFGVAKYAAPQPSTPIAQEETAFARIMRTGTIRCGYYVFPPITVRDPNTNEMSGFSVDFMNSVAEKTGLKIEWTEEVTFGNWVPALQAKRYDVACTPMWPDYTMFKVAAFTEPMFYAGLSPVVRIDDKRFENDKARLNQSDVTIAAQEGNALNPLVHAAFPNAKFYTLPPHMEGAQYYQTILTGKADAMVTDQNGLYQFAQKNGDVLRMVDPAHPVKLQPFPLVVLRDEMILKDFLDHIIEEMNHTGEIDRLLRKWEPEPGETFLRVAPPFQALKETP